MTQEEMDNLVWESERLFYATGKWAVWKYTACVGSGFWTREGLYSSRTAAMLAVVLLQRYGTRARVYDPEGNCVLSK